MVSVRRTLHSTLAFVLVFCVSLTLITVYQTVNDSDTAYENAVRQLSENAQEKTGSGKLAFEENEPNVKTGEKTSERKSMFVVVLAQMRTGSSIVGQLFNQNRDFFYFFEPLYPVNLVAEINGMSRDERDEAILHTLYNMSRCQFSQTFANIMRQWGGKRENRLLAPYCSHSGPCSDVSPRLLHDLCLPHKNRIAIKTIRADIRHLRSLVDEFGIDVRIIHLVRDPRGTTNSRMHYELKNVDSSGGKRTKKSVPASDAQNYQVFRKLVRRNVPNYCRWMERNLLTAKEWSSWLQGRYTLVRYEDFTSAPISMTREIYSFLGLDLPYLVESFIHDATKPMSETNDDRGLFYQRKNSAITASKWRTILSPAQVNEIEEICGKAMDLAGYSTLTKADDLRNFTIPLLKPRKDINIP
ncbi:carbohydrate sulfotransferase 1-like [Diadema antillarum]|uniref:carbohydrate sulfotransferase 1-like n=1 Tax=Diadema antillarum TaxID=105358 RepID=UPI003A8B1AA1